MSGEPTCLQVTNLTVLAWTAGDLKLVSSSPGYQPITEPLLPTGVADAAGVVHPLTGLPTGARQAWASRTDGEAFLVALEVNVGFPQTFVLEHQLWRVAADGAATKLGRYAAPLSGSLNEFKAMDPSGVVYQVAKGIPDTVNRIPLEPSVDSIVYSEADRPANTNQFIKPDLNPWVLIHTGQLVTGP
jgi:hypothetical protein